MKKLKIPEKERKEAMRIARLAKRAKEIRKNLGKVETEMRNLGKRHDKLAGQAEEIKGIEIVDGAAVKVIDMSSSTHGREMRIGSVTSARFAHILANQDDENNGGTCNVAVERRGDTKHHGFVRGVPFESAKQVAVLWAAYGKAPAKE